MAEERLIERAALDALSYHSGLGQSLKQISLRKTPLEHILQDIAQYRESYIDTLIQENLIGSRFKSEDSILRKYEKTLRSGGGFKQCFNDVLGFRLRFAEYPAAFPDYFRVVDLREGKQVDDGYRAIHLYYQRDSHSYPIELQLWCGRDYWFNTVDAPWLAAVHANENVASSAVLQKAGFVYDHDVIDHKFDGTAVPCRAYHLVKEDL